ncbi:SfiI-subtelomeric fragment related protein family member, putative [Theileria annulata]|uniref:SfiI-subtelomeric related protein family member, putative n=1 Tax=Theileria annulata TaxID=5874 RepID=Q4UAS2_THEAN|nr:SfiI-subtelomeric fragment related protein family member, putative [Theileria annulata]CAI76079.1 SfiI-subtelomeric fragment related protein family member, putative [Theileria annulata]
MKRWIITLNLLFYITILNQWNGAESNPTSSSTGSPTSETAAVDSGSTESTPAATTLIHNNLGSSSTTPDATQSSDTATTVAIPIALDLNTSQSTNEFDYTDQNGVVTFKPNSGYVFSKVSQGTKMVWESTNNVHVTLVRTKSEDNKKYLIVLLTNDMFKVYQLEGNEWNDITSMRRDISKLKFLGDTDAEIKSTDYTVSINYFSYEFIFNDGVKCKMIKYGDHEVWKHSDDTKFKMIKKFRLGLVTNSFFVLNESDSKQVAIKVSLNLNISESTDHHNYTDHNGVVTYTTKDGYVFNKIVDGTTGIWESKDDVFSSLVMSKTIDDGKYLSMLLQDNSFKVFHLDVGEWKDLTSKRHDITKLKFLREGDTEITKNDFTVSIADYSYRFTFNSGVSCKKIKFGNADVWKHSEDPKFASLKSFSLDLPTNKFLITNLNDQSKQVGIKVTLDISKTTSTDEFEYKDENEVVTYTPKPGNLFEKIVKKGLVTSSVDVWESKDNVYGTLVRIKVTKGVKYLAIFLDNNMFILFHEEAGTWLDITSSRPDVTKLKFLGDTDVELTSSNYTVIINYFSYEYTFNDGINCVKITYNNIPVWKPTDDSKFAEIKSFRLGFASNNFFVTNSSDQTKHVGVKVDLDISKTQTTSEFEYSDKNEVVTYTVKTGYVFNKVSQGTTVVWVSKDNVFGTLVMSKTVDGVKYLAVLMTNSMFKLFNHYYYEWTEITSTKYDLTKLKFFGNNDTELKSSNLEVSLVDLSYTYKFNSDVKCKKVKYREDDIWKDSDDSNYKSIKSLSLDLSTNKFYVKNQSDQIKEVAIKISLDIDKTESTDEYEYIKDLDFRTYTPKPGHLFKKISHSTIDIWQSKNNLYATLICIKPEGDLKYLAMLFQDNMFKLFHEQEDKPWDNITSKRHDVTKLRFLRDNDSEITSSDYKVNIVDLSYTYIFNSGVTCKKITYNNTPLWSHTDDSNFASIKSLSLDLAKDKFYVKNQSDQLKELDFKTTPETQTTPITLDIEKTETTDEYSYSDQNGLVTFSPKDNYVFNKITQGTKDIWDSGDDVYSTLVMTKDDGNQKYLSMLLQNNSFVVLQKSDNDNEWTNFTAKRHDITKLKFLGDNDVDLMFTDYTVTLVDLSYTFVFKSGVKCKKITYNDKLLWNHTDDTNYAEITLFSLGLTSNKFFVKNSSDQSKELNAVTEIPDEDDDADDQDDDGTIEEDDDDKSDTTSICSDFTESTSADTTPTSAVNKVSLDINKTESTNEFDFADQNGVITYTPKDNHVFNKIIDGTKDVWKSKDNVHASLVRATDDQKYLVILLQNNSFVLLKLSDIPWKDITSEKHDITKLKLLGDNNTELSKTDYTVTISYLSYKFTFNDGVICKKITYNDNPLWTHTDDKDFESLMSFHQDLLTNKLYVMNSSYKTKEVGIKITLNIDKSKDTDQFNYLKNGNFRTYTSKPGYLFSKIMKKGLVGSGVEIWEAKPDDQALKAVLIGSKKNSKYLSILIQSGTFVLLFKSGKNKSWVNVTSERPDVTKLKFLFENDIELYLSDYDRILFEPTYGYKFNDGVNCKYITYSDEFVWKHTDDTKFKSITIFYLDLISNKLFVKNSSNHKMQVGIKVALDIDKTESTEKYYFNDQNGVITFKPKPGFLFNNVTHGTTDIWESKPGLYGSLVMTKTEDGARYIAILMTNNEFVLLKLSGKDLKDITSERPDLKKLKFLGDNDTEITESDYDVTLENDSYTITFDEDVKCKKIKYVDDDLWTHTDDTNFSDIKSFQLDIFMNRFYVTNSSDKTKQVDIKVTLDLEKTETTDKFEYIKDGDCEKYSPKPGYVFNKISEGTTGIWESKDNVYATLVRTKSKNGVKYLALLMTDDMFTVFQEEAGEWHDITSDRHDLSKLTFFGENDTEITKSQYTVTLQDLSYTYKFNDGVTCRKITYNNTPLWTHSDDTDFSDIKSLSLDLPKNKFSVTNKSDEKKEVDVKVSLDIQRTQSTNQFDYTDDNGVVSFTPKSSHVFNKVSEGNTVIWESRDDVYCTLVRTKSVDGVRFLALLLENSLFKLFHLDGNNWKDLTSDRPDITNLKFLDDNNLELKSSDYQVKLVGLSYTIKFNTDVNCKKITYNDMPVWTHTDHANFSEIKSLSLDLPKNKFIIKNSSDQTMQVGVKVSLDIQKTQSTDQFEYFKDDDCHTFTPKSGYIFNKVSHVTDPVWESSDCVFGTLVRTKVSKDVKYLAMLLTNDMFKVFKESDGTWKDITSMRRDVTRLKFIDDNDVEISSSDYTVSIVDLLYNFTFDDGVKCKMITYSDDEVWKHSDDPKFSEITKFRLGLVSNNFFVLNASEFKKVGIKICLDIDKTESTEKYYFNDQNGLLTFTPNSGYVFNKVTEGTKEIWESKDNVYASMTMSMTLDNKKFLAILLTNNMFKLFHLENNEWTDITIQKHNITKLKFFGENDAELKASDYNVSLENDSFTYLFNDGVKCKKIIYSDLDVWNHTDDKDYSEIKSFSLGLSSNKFSVTNSSDHSKQVDVKVTLNIEKTQSTDHFDHSKDDKFHTYTPKDDYVFNKIIKKPLVTSTVDIWESKDDLCGTLVVTKDESGLLNKDKHLAILLKNNTFVLLHSSDKGKNWKDLTDQKYDVTKLKFFDENDIELTASDYEVTLVNLSYQHKFNDSVNCKNITYNDITIWNHSDDQDYSEIKSLHLDLLSNKFSVMNSSDQSKELKDITMVALDIDKTQSTNEFDFADQNGVITYSPKSSHVFIKITQGTTVVWESSNDIQCTLATITSKDDGKYLSILLKDNSFKLFKLDGNNWKDLTDQKYDINKLKFLGEGDTELSKSDYTVILTDDLYEYKFKDSVKCKKITYSDLDAWSHTDDPDFSEIRSLQLGLPSNKLYVTNTSDQKKQVDIKVSLDIQKTESTNQFSYSNQNGLVTYTPKDNHVFNKVSQGTKDIWESKDDVCGTLVMSKTLDNKKYLAILLSDNMFTLFNEDDNEWKDITDKRLDITKLRFLGDNDTPITSSHYTVSLSNLLYTYKFNTGVKCVKITYNDNPLWTHSEDSSFAEIKSLQLDLPTNKLYVTNTSDQKKQVDIKVSLDIENSQSTDDFNFSEDNGVVTFITKDNRVFSKISHGATLVWESTNDVYGTLVRTKTLDNVKFLAVLMTNNMFKLFKEDSSNWTNITSDRLDITKLKFLGDGNAELKSSDYTVNLSNFSYTYHFNTDVSCKNITYADNLLWSPTDDSEFADIKSLQLNLPTNKLYVTNPSDETKQVDIKVLLDLDTSQSTDKFNFSEDNGVVTFITKDNRVFSKLVDGATDIWESKDSVFGSLVISNTLDDVRFLVMLLTDNLFKLFKLDGNEWKDITSERHDIDRLKFFGDSDNPLTKNDYSVTLHGLSYQYKFNTGVKCKKITYDDNDVWTHTYDKDFSEIKSIALDFPKNKFIITNSNDESKELTVKVDLDVNATQSTSQFDYTDQNGLFTYTPKSGFVLNKVVEGTKDIWQSTDDVYGSLVMSKIVDNKKYLAILLTDNTFKVFHEESDEWHDLTNQRHDVTKLKFIGESDTEIKSSDLEVSLVDFSICYSLDNDFMCRKIMYGDYELWTHTDDANFSSIKSLSLDLPNNKFLVKNSSDQSKELNIKVSLDIQKTQSTDKFDFSEDNGVVTYTPKSDHVFNKVVDGSTAIWESSDDVFGTLVRTKTMDSSRYLAILMNDNMFKVFHQLAGQWKDLTAKRLDATKLRFLGDNDSELTTSDYKVDLVDLSYTHIFNSGVKCKNITFDNMPVWTHSEDSSFAELKSIALDLSTNKLYVTNTSDESKELDIKVSLDISKTESTDEYNFNDQSGLFTFKPKDNYVFNKVTDGTTDIWQSKNNLYGTLVMSKTVDNDKYLALLLTNNMFLLFHQDQDGNWANITAMRHDIKKLKFLGDSDNPLSNSDYTVTIVDLSYQYKFKDGVKCHTVKLGEGDLWSHTDDSDFSEIKSFQLDLPTNKFSVTNLKDESIQLSKARVTLDIQNTHSTNECHYSYDHNIHTFTPKPNYVFTKVTQGSTDIWESTDFYGTLAKLKSMDEGNKKYLLLLLDSNKFKLFHEVSGQWQDITAKRHDLTKLKFLRDGNTEITSSDYSIGIVEYSYEYKFNTGVKCRKIMLGEEELWKHTDDTEFQSIKSFSLDLLMNKFFIKNSTDKTKQLGITVNVDIPKLLSTPKSINVTQTPQAETAPTQTQTTPTSTTPESEQTEETTPQSTPETPEAEATQTPETTEATPHTSQTLQAKSTNEPVYQTLTAKSDNLFDKVSDGNTVVWESNDDVCGTMVSIKSDRKEIHLAVLLQDNDFVLVHKDNKDDTWKDITSERADVTNLKFLDDTDTELSPSDYTVTIVDLSYEHKFNEDVKCHTVKYGEDEVWTHTDDTKFSEIKKLSLDLPSNKFTITNLDDQRKELTTTFTRVSVEIKKKDPNRQYDYSKSSNFHKFTPKDGNLFTKVSKGSDVVWDSKVEYVTLVNIKTLNNKTYLSMLLQNNSFVVLQKSDNTWKDITSERYDITKLKFFGDSDNPLTKNDYTTTIADCSYRFKFNTGVICKTIKYGDEDVWKHDDDTNFSEITILDLNLTNNKFSVTNNQSNSKELDYNGSITPAETTPADTSKPKLKLPKLPASKPQTQTSSTKPVSTPAVPTKNTLISLDINSTQSTSEFDYTDQNGVITFTPKDNHVFSKVVDGNNVVWQTKPVLYGTELMYIESVKYLVVQLQDNIFKLFVHFAGIWTDITHKRYDIKKLKFFGDNDTELTSSDYKITIFRFFYTFTFNDAVKCKKIMYGKDDVWKHSDDTEYSEIKKFQIGLASNESFVFNNKLKSKILDYKPETPKTKPKSETPEDDDTTPQETTDTKLPDTKESSDDTSTTPAPVTTKPVTILTVDIDKTQSTDYYDYILEH